MWSFLPEYVMELKKRDSEWDLTFTQAGHLQIMRQRYVKGLFPVFERKISKK